VLEAIDNRDWRELPGELGDLLLQVLFYAEMAREEGLFSINDVLDALNHKLISRHPHVFGSVKADSAGEVLKNWEAIKARRSAGRTQILSTRNERPCWAAFHPKCLRCLRPIRSAQGRPGRF